jgi:hypothetical protein
MGSFSGAAWRDPPKRYGPCRPALIASVLVQLVGLVDRLPALAPSSTPPRRGRLLLYSDTLFVKALVIMIVRRLHKVGELLAVLEEPTQEMRSLRELLCGPEGRFPSRRTFERRLRALPERACPRGSACWDATWSLS